MDDWVDDGYGPPTEADELWYWSHVALAQDRPPARNRQGEPMEGQTTIEDFTTDEYDTASMHRSDRTYPPVLLGRGTWWLNGQQVVVEIPGYYEVVDGEWRQVGASHIIGP